MKLPIYAYGQPVLRRVAKRIDENYEGLTKLIEDMWETMDYAQGVGLAAPQIGKSIRLFIIDSSLIDEKEGVRRVFINAEKVEESGKAWTYEEGCLSIPDIRGDVERMPTIILRYLDEAFKEHTETFSGVTARVIQHEYDHIDGVLFTEHLSPLRRRMLKRRLEKVKKGQCEHSYSMKFVKQ